MNGLRTQQRKHYHECRAPHDFGYRADEARVGRPCDASGRGAGDRNNPRLACGVALAEILTKTALYYVHERAWALIPWGRR